MTTDIRGGTVLLHQNTPDSITALVFTKDTTASRNSTDTWEINDRTAAVYIRVDWSTIPLYVTWERVLSGTYERFRRSNTDPRNPKLACPRRLIRTALNDRLALLRSRELVDDTLHRTLEGAFDTLTAALAHPRPKVVIKVLEDAP